MMTPNALFIFNPDHDLALAHGTNHYMSPTSALQFASDAATLPLWMFPQATVPILASTLPEKFLSLLKECKMTSPLLSDSQNLDDFSTIQAWGWNHNLVQQLLKRGISAEKLPSAEQLERIRQLSHRRLTIRAAEFLRNRVRHPELLPMAASELTDMAEVEGFIAARGEVILKMPWSGSGRGLRKIIGEMSTHQSGWAAQSIRKYGCVMGEPYHTVVQDFAMEFEIDTLPKFSGFSLFSTHNGVYQENLLLSDAAIENALCRYVSRETLAEYRDILLDFLKAEVAPFYRGFVGVDMFVYQKDNAYFVNPFVEFNIRMTMGLASRLFFDQWMREGAQGRWRLRYLSAQNALFEEDKELSQQYPLEIEDGKIVSGYLSLTPIMPQTQYAVQVCVYNRAFSEK